MPEQSISLWRGTTPQTTYPSLKSNISVEIAVIGGGMAGLLASWFLNKSGKETAIFESSCIGCGTSGNTTAKITSFHDLKYNYLIRKFGVDRAAIYANSNQWAIGEFERIITEQKIDCDFQRSPLNVFALSSKGFHLLAKEYDAIGELNLPVTFQKDRLWRSVLTRGEMFYDNQAYFHPGKFMNRLSELLVQHGGKIYENSGILEIEDSDNPIIRTAHCEIRAKKIIIATNFPIYDKGFLSMRMNQVRSHAIAVKLNTPLPQEMSIGVETGDLYLRPHKDSVGEWMIISGAAYPTGKIPPGDFNPFQQLEATARKYLDVKSIDYRWSAQDSKPIDCVPFIGKMPNTKNIYVSTGFGEWGMTTSVVSGKILADVINDIDNKWLNLYSPSRFKPFASIKNTWFLLKQVTERISARQAPIEKFSAEKLEPEQGKIFSVDGAKTAVYKDKEANLHALSANCTHLGCLLKWNPLEKSWDCPCHGSRFDIDGQILNSPAIKPLDKIENTKD